MISQAIQILTWCVVEGEDRFDKSPACPLHPAGCSCDNCTLALFTCDKTNEQVLDQYGLEILLLHTTREPALENIEYLKNFRG